MNKYYAIYNPVTGELSKAQCRQLNAENIEITQEVYNDFDRYVYVDGQLIEDEEYEIKEYAKKIEQFNMEFFNTTLGYIRRKVTMKDGTTKDFLTDIVPLLQVGVNIITYSFTDGEITQNTNIPVTEEFISECKQQVFKDFYGE